MHTLDGVATPQGTAHFTLSTPGPGDNDVRKTHTVSSHQQQLHATPAAIARQHCSTQHWTGGLYSPDKP